MGKYLIQLSLLVVLGLGIFFTLKMWPALTGLGNPARSAQLAEEQVERLNVEIQVQKL